MTDNKAPKPKKPLIEDDFVNDSERPFTNPERVAVPRGNALEQYLTAKYMIPAALLAIALLAFLYWANIFQMIAVIIAAAVLLLLAVVIIAYLDNSLTAENADLLTRIDLRDWRTLRAALKSQNALQKQAAPAAEDSDEDDIFGENAAPFYGQTSKVTVEDARVQVAQRTLQVLKSDLLNHIDNQRRNGNLQMVLLIIVTVVAMSVLVGASLNSANNVRFSLSQCLIGAVLSLFVACFAFLYAKTQKRILYAQNELTNLNARISAFQLAYLLEEQPAIAAVIAELTHLDRNSQNKID